MPVNSIKSKDKVYFEKEKPLPDGIYNGTVGGKYLSITYAYGFGCRVELDCFVKTTGLPVFVVIKDSIAYCYDIFLSMDELKIMLGK